MEGLGGYELSTVGWEALLKASLEKTPVLGFAPDSEHEEEDHRLKHI